MNLIKWTPTPARRVSEFDRLFNGFLSNAHCDCEDEACAWAPRADINESDKAYHLLIDLPGLDKGDIDIKVEDQTLVISGERKADEDESITSRRIERMQGKFLRRFRLPKEADIENITAEHKNGLLKIDIAKSEKVAGRQIEVK